MAWYDDDISIGMIKHLMDSGWYVYDYAPRGFGLHYMYDDDCVQPSVWSGVAERNGYLFVAHNQNYGGNKVRHANYSGRTLDYETFYHKAKKNYASNAHKPDYKPLDKSTVSDTSSKLLDKIKKLEQVTQANNATEFEEQTAKAKIEILRNQIATSSEAVKEDERYVPKHLPNPPYTTWHLELNGIIVAVGKGLNDPGKVMSIIQPITDMILLDVQNKWKVVEDYKVVRKYVLDDNFSGEIGELFTRIDPNNTDLLKDLDPANTGENVYSPTVYKIIDYNPSSGICILQEVNALKTGTKKKKYKIMKSSLNSGEYKGVKIVDTKIPYPVLKEIKHSNKNAPVADNNANKFYEIVKAVKPLSGYEDTFIAKIEKTVNKSGKCSERQLEVACNVCRDIFSLDVNNLPNHLDGYVSYVVDESFRGAVGECFIMNKFDIDSDNLDNYINYSSYRNYPYKIVAETPTDVIAKSISYDGKVLSEKEYTFSKGMLHTAEFLGIRDKNLPIIKSIEEWSIDNCPEGLRGMSKSWIINYMQYQYADYVASVKAVTYK